MATYGDILDICMTRAERLGLVDSDEGKADAVELELYIYQALLSIVEIVDVPAYLRRDTHIAITKAGLAEYPVPKTFGRLILPRVRNRRGIFLYDTVANDDLEYIDPNSFSRKSSSANTRPTQFTVMQRKLWLYPPPDGNGSNDYTLRGLYIEIVERPDPDDVVLLDHPMALVEETLFRLGSDMNRLPQGLAQTRQEALGRLVGQRGG